MYRWFFVPMLLIGSITLATSPYPLAAQTQDPFQSAPGPVPEPAKPATQGRSSSHPRERVTIERVLVPTPVPTEPVRPLSVPISPIPAPQPSPAGPLDGTYRGTVTAVATITAGHGRHGGGHHENCQAGRPVQMNISGGAVTIHQAMVDVFAVRTKDG